MTDTRSTDPFPPIELPPSTTVNRMATTATSLGGAFVAMVVIWVLSLYNVTVPPPIELGLGAFLSSIGAWFVHRLPPPLTAAQHEALLNAFLSRLSRSHPALAPASVSPLPRSQGQ